MTRLAEKNTIFGKTNHPLPKKNNLSNLKPRRHHSKVKSSKKSSGAKTPLSTAGGNRLLKS